MITKKASLTQEGEEGINNVGIGSSWPSLSQSYDLNVLLLALVEP
jgi:hypothetical protein